MREKLKSQIHIPLPKAVTESSAATLDRHDDLDVIHRGQEFTWVISVGLTDRPYSNILEMLMIE